MDEFSLQPSVTLAFCQLNLLIHLACKPICLSSRSPTVWFLQPFPLLLYRLFLPASLSLSDKAIFSRASAQREMEGIWVHTSIPRPPPSLLFSLYLIHFDVKKESLAFCTKYRHFLNVVLKYFRCHSISFSQFGNNTNRSRPDSSMLSAWGRWLSASKNMMGHNLGNNHNGNLFTLIFTYDVWSEWDRYTRAMFKTCLTCLCWTLSLPQNHCVTITNGNDGHKNKTKTTYSVFPFQFCAKHRQFFKQMWISNVSFKRCYVNNFFSHPELFI